MRAWPIFASLVVLPSLAWGQPTDYSAGKTPAQLFASDCSACHQTPRGLAKGKPAMMLSGFLRGHYTTKAESAEALAAFLAASPAPANEARGRQPGAGAGRGPAAEPRGLVTRPPSPPAVVEGQEDVVTPGGEALQKRRGATAARDAAKPNEPRAGAKARGKPDPAEAAREAAAREAAEKEKAAEAAKAAEEAVRNKVRAYATEGDEAKLKSAAHEDAKPQTVAPAEAQPERPAEAAAPTHTTGSTPSSQPAEVATPNTETPRSEPPATAAPTAAPSTGERPASTPPG